MHDATKATDPGSLRGAKRQKSAASGDDMSGTDTQMPHTPGEPRRLRLPLRTPEECGRAAARLFRDGYFGRRPPAECAQLVQVLRLVAELVALAQVDERLEQFNRGDADPARSRLKVV